VAQKIEVKDPYQNIFYKYPFPALIISKEIKQILAANKSAEKVFGFDSKKILKLNLSALSPDPQVINLFNGRNGTGKKSQKNKSFLFQTKSGKKFFSGIYTERVNVNGSDSILLLLLDLENQQAKSLQKSNSKPPDEKSYQKLLFLAEASSILFSSLDYRTTLSKLGTLFTPQIADWFVVDILDEKGVLQRVAVSHSDPKKIKLAYKLHQKYPPVHDTPRGVYQVIKKRKPELYENIEPEFFRRASRSEEQYKMFMQLGLRSAMIIPLIARDQVLGAITFVSAESGRNFNKSDLKFAQDVALRTAIAIDNAKLYNESLHMNKLLEEKIADRTVRLIEANATLENEILERRKAEAELQNAHANLEQRIKERTAQLEVSNEELQNEIAIRKKVEQKLRKSEERLHLALNANQLGMWYSNLPFDFLEWSSKTKEHFGLKPDEDVYINNFYGLLHPDDRQKVKKALNNSIKNHGIADVEFRVSGDQKNYKWLRLMGKAFYDEAGGPVRFDGVTLDINDNKRVEERLIQNEQRLRAAVFASETGTFIWHVDNDIIEIDDNKKNLLGIAHEEDSITLDRLRKIIHKDDDEEFMLRVKNSQKNGADFNMELRIILPDGNVRWLLDRGKMFKDSKGNLKYMAGACVDITKRKQIEIALHESEARFRQIAENIRDIFFVTDGTTKKVKYISPAFEEVWGISSAMLYTTARGWTDTVHDDDKARIKASLEMQDKIGKFNEVFRIIRPDDSIRWIRSRSYAIKNGAGEITDYVGIAEDITERKLAEEERDRLNEEIQAQRERLNRLISNVPGVVWEAYGQPDDSKQRIDFVSEYVESMLGYSVNEWISEPNFWLKIIHPDDKQRAADEARDIFNGNRKGISQFRWIAKNGKELWVEAQSIVVHDNDGMPIGMRGVTMDISQRIRGEEQIQHLGRILENSLNEIYIFDAETFKFTQVNNGARQNLGYSMEELKKLTPLDLKPDYSQAEFNELLEPLISGKTDQQIFTTRHRRKDGTFYLVEVRLQLSRLETPPVFVATILDITERMQVQEKIEASLKEKEILLREIHHRVKNNLQIISSLLSLQSGYIQDQKAIEYFLESQNRIKSMALIHEKLYKLKDFANIDFSGYIAELTSYLSATYNTDPKKVDVKVEINNINLDLDKAITLGLIINELVSNALKYAFPGDKKGKILVQNFKRENKIILIVKDDGIGFPEDIDFENTNSLGLQLVNAFAAQLGGKLELTRGAGTEFIVEF
jgi:PAS domain S-box-containing protein